MKENKNDLNQKILLDLLKDLRLKKRLMQNDVAAKLNLPQSFVSKYECGDRRLDIFELRMVCEALGIKLLTFVSKLEEKLNKNNESQ